MLLLYLLISTRMRNLADLYILIQQITFLDQGLLIFLFCTKSTIVAGSIIVNAISDHFGSLVLLYKSFFCSFKLLELTCQIQLSFTYTVITQILYRKKLVICKFKCWSKVFVYSSVVVTDTEYQIIVSSYIFFYSLSASFKVHC